MDLWLQIKSMYEKSNKHVRFYEGTEEQGATDIAKLNVSPDSVFGTIIANTGGIVVDNWLSILGQLSYRYAGAADFADRMGLDFGNMLVVAVDVVGGVFAINMGRFEEDAGLVWYFAPDTVNWEPLKFSYSEFIAWTAQGDLDGFYQAFRWSTWKKDVETIEPFNKGILIYPFLWSKECDVETASKKAVPLKEIISINMDFEKKFADS